MINEEIIAENAVLKQKNAALKQKNSVAQSVIKSLKSQLQLAEARLALLTAKTFHKKSEKHLQQPELPFEFNEAEVLADAAEVVEETTIPAHTRKKRKSRTETQTPAHLPRVDVHHKADITDCPCCTAKLVESTPEIQEQLACLPTRYYVVRHHYQKLTCSCQDQPPVVAKRPVRALPKSSIHPLALATWIEQKYEYGLPLYRLEKMAKAEGIEISRSSIAESIIKVSQRCFQPLINLFNDVVLEYDIMQIDETSLQVLKEIGKSAESKSFLWIRRGGAPGKESIILNYSPYRNFETCESLLPDFNGYLISDAYTTYVKAGTYEHITNVFCSDHARRKFKEAYDTLDKKSRKGSIADQALIRYAKLYKLEKEAQNADPPHRLQMRQTKAKPLWQNFIDWMQTVQLQGVAHPKTAHAIDYFLRHKDGLQTYLKDGRLPISNILAEHVAKHVAVSRKNFLFSCTPSGATASANCFSVIQTAKLHGHQIHKYLAVLITEIPAAQTPEEIEAYLPWNISPQDVALRYQKIPVLM
ncbi:MAG TPA: IS66 family transposase [Gammaproteobacteria bacterium]|nr:hypothetical protein [Gammaproteobacteria bacterium]HCK92789.1 IS66 family transposase [Gammaproteobacteria bacterium]